MHIYLARHGESCLNAQRVHQVSSVGLSAVGMRQSQLLARRLAPLSVDVLLSSPYDRARQTAALVAEAAGHTVRLVPLLVELKRPSAIEGRSYDDPDVLAIKETITQNIERADWRYADEETFYEAQARGRRCLAFIAALEAETVVAITHGGFLTMLAAMIVHGSDLRPRDFLRWRLSTGVHNTGIVRCDFTADRGWTLVTWNDYSHLASLHERSVAPP